MEVTGVPEGVDDSTWSMCPKLFAFDIECYSSNYRRLPMKEVVTDVITMISVLTMRVGDFSSMKRFILLVGECIPIEGAEVRYYPSETGVLLAFLDLIKTEDPEVLIGFNSFGFDIPYIDYRLGKKIETWGETSRIRGQIPMVKERKSYSDAFGHQIFHELKNMEGRIHIDARDIIKRDFKLRRYSLDYIGHELLNEGKHDIKPQEMFQIFDNYRRATNPESRAQAIEDTTRVAKYCIQDSELVLRLFDKFNMWVTIMETSNIVFCTPSQVYSRGQQIKCKAQIYNLAHSMGYIIDRQGETYPYKGAYVHEIEVPGMKENVITLDFASLYPSIMMAWNICYTTILGKWNFNAYPADDIYEHEFDEDFTEKVPIESERGLAHLRELDAKGKKPDDDDDEDDENDDDDDDDDKVESIQDEIERLKIKLGLKRRKYVQIVRRVHYHIRFLRQHVKRGVVPLLVEKLVSRRKQVKKLKESLEQAENPDWFLINKLDKRQLAIKVSANSMYGFYGVPGDKALLPLILGAVTITYMGRTLINKVNTYLNNTYNYNVVYNDTDSAFIDCLLENSAQCHPRGKELEKEITSLFPPPVKMEFEKALRVLLIKRKKYAYILIKENGSFECDKDGKPVLHFKGILSARRDNWEFLLIKYNDILEKIMLKINPRITLVTILIAIEKLIYGLVEPRQLAVNKSMGSNYDEDCNATMKVFGDVLKEAGHPIQAGERLDYVVVDTGIKKDKQGKKARLLELYVESENPEPIDVEYYLKAFSKSIDQLFDIGYRKDYWSKCHPLPGYKHSRRAFTPISTPVSLYLNARNEGMSHSDIQLMMMNMIKAVLNHN
jgi:DNA polymerase elongation subunit (family B)